MAVAFDTASGTYNAGPVTSASLDKASSGSNRLAIIAAMPGGNVGDTLTSVTVEGSAATFINKVAVNATQYLYLYYYVAPPTSATTTYTVNVSGATDIGIAVATYTGVDQVTPVTTSNTGTATGNLTVSVTTTVDNSWLVGMARNLTAGPPGAGTGTTSRDTTNLLFLFGDSNGAKTPTGSYSMQFTSATDTTGGIVAAIAPSTTATAAYSQNNMLLLGVS